MNQRAGTSGRRVTEEPHFTIKSSLLFAQRYVGIYTGEGPPNGLILQPPSLKPITRATKSLIQASMTVTPITTLDEFNELINSGKIICIDFWATWCVDRHLALAFRKDPIFEKLSESEDFGGAEFYKVDVDEASDVSSEVGIKAMPTFMIFKDGEKLGELVGADDEELENLLKTHAVVAEE
ncbi:hypothetical protein FRC00_014303 [Tulasnella sp. 408]|nr:hypothetical protein FRC00_014303 [Tulasnella sp. 408]